MSKGNSRLRYSKYRAKPHFVDGYHFPSQKEAARYCELKILERAGQIKNLKVHPVFELFVQEMLVGKYIPDFSYIQRGNRVIEDVKGYKKGVAYSLFKLKKNLMKALYSIEVQEV